MDERESVRFDRAADFYDESRAYAPELALATTELLAAELRGRGRILEVGVGTGLIALPLQRAGIPMAGLDLSAPMVGKLVEKGGGRASFPTVLGDATALPFRTGAVGGGLIRWVLHLIPAWRGAIAELVRVIAPRGVLVVNLGHAGEGPWGEMRARFSDLTGVTVDPVGIGWHAEADLDAEVARHGATVRLLPALLERSEEPLGTFLDSIERNLYSWTWPVPEDVRLGALRELRPWARERYGPLDRPYPFESEIVWRAYDLP
jgi:SAM-dependent methyltransferase